MPEFGVVVVITAEQLLKIKASQEVRLTTATEVERQALLARLRADGFRAEAVKP